MCDAEVIVAPKGDSRFWFGVVGEIGQNSLASRWHRPDHKSLAPCVVRPTQRVWFQIRLWVIEECVSTSVPDERRGDFGGEGALS